MEPTEADKKRFLESFEWYQQSCTAMLEAKTRFIKTANAAREVLRSTPIAPQGGSIENWDPAPTYGAVAAMRELADAHTSIAEALHIQADALERTTTIALELIEQVREGVLGDE